MPRGITRNLLQANRALLTNIYEHYCADIAGSVLKSGASPGGAGSSGGGSAGAGATGGSVASRSSKGGNSSIRRRRLMSFEEALQMVRDFGISPQHIKLLLLLV